MNWATLDWEVLDRLRENFLSGPKTGSPYWHTITDLECYDFTYAERIGWKWDAVLRELKLRGWTPPTGGPWLDWGCGSGVAGRRVLDAFGGATGTRLLLHDHSALAIDYATHAAVRQFPHLQALKADRRFLEGADPIGVLIISHVLNELDDRARAELRTLIARSAAVIWVEPGTHEISRSLGAWREMLRDTFQVIAPCTHQAACGVLTAGNERHWCHFFAAPPAGVYADSGWVKFGQRAGIDLRSLPYSFVVLDRRKLADPCDEELSRILGEPRHYKGYAKIFNCDHTGVTELQLQKRDAPDIFKALKHPESTRIYRWTRQDGRISAGTSRFD